MDENKIILTLDMNMPFGKHRGRLISEVAEKDRQYFEWMRLNVPAVSFGDDLNVWLDELDRKRKESDEVRKLKILKEEAERAEHRARYAQEMLEKEMEEKRCIDLTSMSLEDAFNTICEWVESHAEKYRYTSEVYNPLGGYISSAHVDGNNI